MTTTERIKIEAEIMNEIGNLKDALDCTGVDVMSPAGSSEYRVRYQLVAYGHVVTSALMPIDEIADHLRSIIAEVKS